MNNKEVENKSNNLLREIPNVKISQEKNNHAKTDLKVELLSLRLEPTSEKLILETLKRIHGPDFVLSNSSDYQNQKSNLKTKFWMDRGNLVVKGGTDNAQQETFDATQEDKFKRFARQRLESYGFHQNHCIEALERCNGELDSALQLLYSKYYNLKRSKVEEDLSEEMLLEQREDEKNVLQSIYEKAFQEKIANSVWILTFELDYLLDMLYDRKKPEPKSLPNVKKQPMCRNFLRGIECKYGNKCRFSHEDEKKKDNKNEHYSNSRPFQLEIRFPSDSRYPYEPPMIFLKTESILPEQFCLHVCRRLIQEAKEFSTAGMVSIYSVAELLNNETEMVQFLKSNKEVFPHEEESLFPEVINENSNILSNLPTHYKKGLTNKDYKTSLTTREVLEEDKYLVKQFERKKSDPNYLKMIESRKKLPAFEFRNKILGTIFENQVIVISGETGCGKSTQIPQFILDDWLNNFENNHVEIVCTQPRRLSAIGVAERIADERVESVGRSVGYQIRLESKVSSQTRLTFCTTGILLRRLETDPYLYSVTHIIVDEVHERSEESDFLLLILKNLLHVRRDLKVILMSATLNAQVFCDYFGSVPIFEIPGRTFPVQQFFLEDAFEMTQYVLEENSEFSRNVKKISNKLEEELETLDMEGKDAIPKDGVLDENLTILQTFGRYQDYSHITCKNLYMTDPEKTNLEFIENLITWIAEGDHDFPRTGSILVFLPGLAEITSLYDQLNNSSLSPRYGKFVVLPLHSTLTSEEQSAIFRRPKNNARKIVLSTNIAETSVTIDDCVFVIDSGKMKEKRFDPNKNMESLELVWVSKANAMQRKGRAGRVMPGVCFHLFTHHRFKHHLLSQPVPEIHRIPLDQLVLKIKVLPNFSDMKIHQVLGKTLEPPSEESIDSAIVRLQDVGALDEHQTLTHLGLHLAALPVDVRIGKLMLFGAIFCCVDSALTIAACLNYKSPFVMPFGKKEQANERKKKFICSNSDHLTVLNAYKKWKEAVSKSRQAGYVFAQENFLSMKTMETLADIKYQLLELLVSIGFVPVDLIKYRRSFDDRVLEITGPEMNKHGENHRLLCALLCAALYPNVVKVLTPEKSFTASAVGAVPKQTKAEELRFKTKQDGYVFLHPSSVNYTVGHYPSPYLVYQEKIKTSRIFIRDCSMIPSILLVLFSGFDLKIEVHNGSTVIVLDDGWILFEVEKHEVAEMLKMIRIELFKLLEEKIKDPCLNLLHHENGKGIISTIVHIVTNE